MKLGIAPCILKKDVKWHKDAKLGSEIKQEHNEFMVTQLCDDHIPDNFDVLTP